MGGLGDGSESGKTREINKFYFHMHTRALSNENHSEGLVGVQLKIELVVCRYNINTLDLRYVEN
jgi:hypothetical protein